MPEATALVLARHSPGALGWGFSMGKRLMSTDSNIERAALGRVFDSRVDLEEDEFERSLLFSIIVVVVIIIGPGALSRPRSSRLPFPRALLQLQRKSCPAIQQSPYQFRTRLHLIKVFGIHNFKDIACDTVQSGDGTARREELRFHLHEFEFQPVLTGLTHGQICENKESCW
jgi:hypothetical protein